MRALFVAPYLPTPGSGGRTRVINLMERLAKEHDLRIVAFAAPDQTAADNPYPGVVLPPPPRRARPGGRRRDILRFYGEKLGRDPSFVRWMRSAAMARAIEQTIAEFAPDVVQIEHTEMAQYRSAIPAGPARILDLHDVASRWFAHAVAKREQSSQQRAMMAIELRKTRRYESAAARAFDAVFVTSALERAFLHDLCGVDGIEVPNGVDPETFAPMPDVAEQPDRLVFVGPLTYDANIDGLRWFAREVLPLVQREIPGVAVDVVGTPVDERFPDAMTLHGRVEDVRPYLARAPVSIVPVRLASGTRYKILESLSMQRAVVSTSLGADGLGVAGEEHLLIADDAEAFARATVRLLRDPALRARLGVAGRAFVAARYDWSMLVARVAETWDQVVSARRA